MNMNRSNIKSFKSQLHPRNRHRNGYDFQTLMEILPEFSQYVSHNQYGNLSIDFSEPNAVKLLNKALLLQFYRINYWDIPKDYLCPPIPGRADYIHYLADLLAQDNHGKIPKGRGIRVLDIGIGANVIYPIIGHAEYGWSFIGSDINQKVIKLAKQIAQANGNLSSALECRWQKDNQHIFKNIINHHERFALTLCNPPFHGSLSEAQAATQRKLFNLGKSFDPAKQPMQNFGGQNSELWCKGGEVAFIGKMIQESTLYKQHCLWFSSLVSKKDSLAIIKRKLKQINAQDVITVPMAQGQKISRFIAWSFYTSPQRQKLLSQWQHKTHEQ